MNQREQLEWAAKACGKELQYCTVTDYKGAIVDQFICNWRPDTDQADSDRMACKLRIEILFFESRVIANPRRETSAAIHHNNTDEDVCRAVREARLLVAVEIGRGK